MDTAAWSRREFLRTLGVAAAGCCLNPLARAQTTSSQRASEKRPNIILIMVDDMGFSDLGCYGASVIQTPHIDGLAARGLRFSQFYNAARCCPTRASLLTGLYPHQAGMGGMVKKSSQSGPYQGYLNRRCITIAEVLRAAGYATFMSGKWHVGEERPYWPTDRGFDHYFGLINGAANYWDITKTKTKTKTKAQGVVRQLVLDDQPFTPPKQGFYLTEAITNHAIRMLDEYGRDQRPFFQYIAYNAPHWPLHALPEDIAKYQGKFLRGWDALRSERYARLKRMNIIKENWPLSPRDDDVAAWDKVEDKDQMDLKMAVYAAQIDRVDQGIGRILATLRRIGQEDNTLILFLSDNGGCHEGGPWGFDNRKNGLPPGDVDSFMSYGRSWANLSNTPFRLFKHWVHEGGIATPLIVSWPGQIATAGAVTHQVGHVIDIMATCCDAAGIEYPATFQGQAITPLEGRSLVPVFQDKQRSGHDVLYWEHLGNRACRQGKWKLVSRGNNRWELYDLEADRTELNDLSGEQPEKARELTELYAAWARRCGVK